MRITDAKVIVCSQGRNFVTLKITTEDGVYGLGDATLNGRELAVASYLADHVIRILIGRDARRIEDTWQYLYKGAYWRRGPVTMSAISAVDTALWDIKAKTLDVPLYQLLGGASDDGSSRRRHFASSQNRKSGGDVSRKNRFTRRYRSQPGLYGRCSAF
jgi:mannonate dehydratase